MKAFLPLLTALGCTPWMGHTEVARLDAPIEATVAQSHWRYLWFSGSKVLFLPYLGTRFVEVRELGRRGWVSDVR